MKKSANQPWMLDFHIADEVIGVYPTTAQAYGAGESSDNPNIFEVSLPADPAKRALVENIVIAMVNACNRHPTMELQARLQAIESHVNAALPADDGQDEGDSPRPGN